MFGAGHGIYTGRVYLNSATACPNRLRHEPSRVISKSVGGKEKSFFFVSSSTAFSLRLRLQRLWLRILGFVELCSQQRLEGSVSHSSLVSQVTHRVRFQFRFELENE